VLRDGSSVSADWLGPDFTVKARRAANLEQRRHPTDQFRL